jgi:hypothetical protein
MRGHHEQGMEYSKAIHLFWAGFVSRAVAAASSSFRSKELRQKIFLLVVDLTRVKENDN